MVQRGPLPGMTVPAQPPGMGGRPYEPPPEPGHFVRSMSQSELRCRASRVQLAGGALNEVLTDPATSTPFEQVFRRLPGQGIHNPNISPARPFFLELGSFRVPSQQTLLLFDLRPDIYRFSGVDPNDALPVAARRFATQVGYDLTINGNHPGNTRFELEPIEPQQGLAFQPNQGTDRLNNPGRLPSDAEFVQARRNRFGAASGAGTSLMPQRTFRFGPSSLPLTLVLEENQSLALQAVVFKPIQSPIAFIEFDIAGILAPKLLVTGLLDCLALKSEAVK